MTLEQQVVNLELSKKLDELGVKAESHFYWFPKIALRSEKPTGDGIVETEVIAVEDDWYVSCNPAEEMRIHYPAYSVAELFGMMPSHINVSINVTVPPRSDEDEMMAWLSLSKSDDGTYVAGYGENAVNHLEYEKENPADALAKMLIYLIENGLIDPPK